MDVFHTAILIKHRNQALSLATCTKGKDGHGLKLEKTWPAFSSFNATCMCCKKYKLKTFYG